MIRYDTAVFELKPNWCGVDDIICCLANKESVSALLLQQKAVNISGKDKESLGGRHKSKKTEEAYKENMGQIKKDRESSM